MFKDTSGNAPTVVRLAIVWGLPFGVILALTTWPMMHEKIALPGHANAAFVKWLIYWMILGLAMGVVWGWVFRWLAHARKDREKNT